VRALTDASENVIERCEYDAYGGCTVLDADRNDSCQLTARPWKRFKPETTSWWLAPSTEWPAYGRAKCHFGPSAFERATFAALHLEKGLDPALKELFPSRRASGLFMDGGWAWHRFLPSLASDALRRVADGLAREHEAALRFALEGGYVQDVEGFDPLDEDSPIRFDRVLHLWLDGIGRLKLERFQPRGKVLAEAGLSLDLPEYAALLARCSEDPWVWFDLKVGIMLHGRGAAKENADPWDGAPTWSRVLRPLLELI